MNSAFCYVNGYISIKMLTGKPATTTPRVCDGLGKLRFVTRAGKEMKNHKEVNQSRLPIADQVKLRRPIGRSYWESNLETCYQVNTMTNLVAVALDKNRTSMYSFS